MKSKSFYQKKSISKIDDKDKEKLKEENEILRKNSKKMTNPNTQKNLLRKRKMITIVLVLHLVLVKKKMMFMI